MLKKIASFTLLSTIFFTAQAQPNLQEHIVVAPQCLIKQLTVKKLAAIDSLALIQVNDTGINQLIETKNQQKIPCGGFIDVTQAWQTKGVKDAKTFLAQYEKPVLKTQKSSYSIQYPNQVNQLLKQINPQNMWRNLTTLSNFKDRYAGSGNGLLAAYWIKNEVEGMIKHTHRSDVTVYLVNTGLYKQPSVVAKVGNSNEPGIVIGGHMDTLSSTRENKPGADDDGTGSVTVLELAHTILYSGMQFKKPIYFIWYAAEELGLVGSQYVVADFKNKSIPIDAVIQFDMTGYAHNNDPTMWLIDDYVNPDLTAYLEQLIKTYVKQPVDHLQCGYACSDHASWHQAGYVSSAPFEASFETHNPYIHTSQDTMEKISLQHMTDYLKLATAFAVEMAEPK